MSEHQITMVSLDELVSPAHQYRKFKSLFNFKAVETELLALECEANNKGHGILRLFKCLLLQFMEDLSDRELERYLGDSNAGKWFCDFALMEKTPDHNKGHGILRLFKCLLLQFMEDLSDRELERYLGDSNAGKWFCDFALMEKTPDHSVFSKIRKKIGTEVLSKIFTKFRDQLRAQGYMSEVFTFVDASHLISKANLWEERDELRKLKYDKLNNETLPKVAKDKQAKIGCKGGSKFWYGYKKHVSVDIQSGMINKVAVTPANLTDSQGFKHVMPSSGATYVDKGYCTKPARIAAARKGVHLCAIKKNNMKGKNFDLDKYYTKIRAPFERVFSQDNKRVRYSGIAKNQFTEFMNAICFNLKRLTVLTAS